MSRNGATPTERAKAMTKTSTATALDNLSNGAVIVLSALLAAAKANGYDFGLMEDAREYLQVQMSSKRFAAFVGALQDFIADSEEIDVDPGNGGPVAYYVQYALTEATLDSEDEIHARAQLAAAGPV